MLEPVTLLPPGKELIRTIHILVYYFSLAGRRKKNKCQFILTRLTATDMCQESRAGATTTSYSSQAVKYRWFLLLAIYCTGFVEAQTSQTSWLFLLSMTVRRPLTWTIRVSPSCEPLIIAKGPPSLHCFHVPGSSQFLEWFISEKKKNRQALVHSLGRSQRELKEREGVNASPPHLFSYYTRCIFRGCPLMEVNQPPNRVHVTLPRPWSCCDCISAYRNLREKVMQCLEL